MSEQPVQIQVADDEDGLDKVLTITMSVAWGANLDRFTAYLADELQTLSHDTYKQHWD